MSPFFGPKIGEDEKKEKGFCRKRVGGFLAQMELGTKQNEKIRSSPPIIGVMVSHHNLVSPQNGVTRGAPPPERRDCLYPPPPPWLRLWHWL